MTEGHPMAHEFDAATRPGLSERAAGQINWVHHRFWSEMLPTWDRVWNDAWAQEREQQREWLMIAYLPADEYVFNNPNHDFFVRYWGPLGLVTDPDNPGYLRPKLFPLVDFDKMTRWVEDRGIDLHAVGDRFAFDWDEDALALFTYEDMWVNVFGPDLDLPDNVTPLYQVPELDPELAVWQEWARSVDLEALLGPEAAGGKMGPEPGEMWYQWHPESLDVSVLIHDEFTPFRDMDFWWPQRLEVPVHSPEQFAVGGTIAPQNPDTGNYYFEVCLWASGGLFGPWSLPHPELPTASANTSWWFTGWADPDGTMLEISEPTNRPCTTAVARSFFERNWADDWTITNIEKYAADAVVPDERFNDWYPDPDSPERMEREAYIDMLARNDLGSWMWRENPNPDSRRHRWLGWEPPHNYTKAPETIGLMIQPVYVWDPEGTPVGYPGGNIQFPWKWWPITPAREHQERHPQVWQFALGGCHNPDEPYLWVPNSNRMFPGLTTDGGPVWAWPGTIHAAGWVRLPTELSEAAEKAWLEEHDSLPNPLPPWLGGGHLDRSQYFPPVPCEDIAAGKYEPDAIGLNLTYGTSEAWMPTVGDRPPDEWLNPRR